MSSSPGSPSPLRDPRVLRLGAGALASLAAWGVLVWIAVGFGSGVRRGDAGSIALVVAISLAAIGFLYLALVFGLRARVVRSEPAVLRRPGGGHRAE